MDGPTFAVVASLVGAVVGAAVLVRALARLPPAPEPPPRAGELLALPPGPNPSACLVCGHPASRRPPTLTEVRGWVEALARWLPLGPVPTRYRRDVSTWAVPSLCELHAAVADRVLDEWIADEDRTIAAALRTRAERAARFQRAELAEILERVRAREARPVRIGRK